MIQLSADLSDPLFELIHAGAAPIDAVEVGPWFTEERIRAYRYALPQIPFHFHGGNMIARVGWLPGAVSRIAAYVQASASPWVSLHLTLRPPGLDTLILRNRWLIPRPFPEAATRRLIWQAKVLSRRLSVPVLLENLEPLYPGERNLESQPERIARVLESTDCGFLLDTGHACVAAAAHGLSIGDYVARLPLNRVVQVHMSGPRLRNGMLMDAHEPLQEDDYSLLDWLIGKTDPRVVTLEYFRDRAILGEQLARLRGILDARGLQSKGGGGVDDTGLITF